jgi:nitroimidazol reductase NimA-like FMN-containing flavoprotein (pyridoxamine 5'-phosphate oxidase superfamily)
VEQIRDLTNWRSVIAWGRYEELNGDAAAMAMGLLIERLSPIVASATMPRTPHTAITPHGHLETGEEAVVFCLNLTEKSGRFERNLPGE